MSKQKQTRRNRLASITAMLAIVGFIGSYTPSMLSWWEETWYPHGREPRVVQPRPEFEPFISTVPPDSENGPVEWGDEMNTWPELNLRQMPLPIMAQSVRHSSDNTGV
jgi:hypothetical protein